MPGPIHVVIASDNYFAPMAAALAKSIELNHHTPEPIEFYIISDGISAKNRRRITESVTASWFRIHWLRRESVVPNGMRLPTDTSSLPQTIHLRFFVPYIVPADAQRVIYLDVDMLVVRDIAELWHTDLQGRTCAAVQDRIGTVSCSWGGIRNYKELGLHPDTKYCNSGLLLIDVAKWRAADITNTILRCIAENGDHVTWPDQYGLNVVLANQWLELDPRWNWFVLTPHTAPYVIHFITERKPIFATYDLDESFRQQFFYYLDQTPWQHFSPISRRRQLVHKLYSKTKKILLHSLRRQRHESAPPQPLASELTIMR